MKKQFKIMTYNICHGADYSNANNQGLIADWWNIQFDKTAKIIKESCADFIGLNEVYNSGGETLNNQVEKIAELAGYEHSRFGEAKFFEKTARSYGNACISKYKIIDSKVYSVPSPVGDERRENETKHYEDRGVLKVVLDVEGVAVSVYVTHFGLNLMEQERMIDTLIEQIDKDDNPHILIGDFNVEPDAGILKPIFDRMLSAARECNNTQKTFATYDEKEQIDYIFVSKDFIIEKFYRVDVNVSDHYPCVAELVLNL